jgi:hypothetical protein
MRRVLRACVGVWIACQLVAAAAPLTLFSDSFGIDQASCCPGVGPGQICPMHHKTANDRSTCRMESACAHHDAALLTTLATGALPPPPLALPSFSVFSSVDPVAASAVVRTAVPDAPPPQSLV